MAEPETCGSRFGSRNIPRSGRDYRYVLGPYHRDEMRSSLTYTGRIIDFLINARLPTFGDKWQRVSTTSQGAAIIVDVSETPTQISASAWTQRTGLN